MNTTRKQNFKNKTKMKHYIYLLCGVFGCLNYDVQVDCMRNIYDKLTDYLLAAYKSNCGEAIYKDMSSVDTTNNNLYDNLATYINLMSDFSNQGLKPQYIKNAFIATVNNHFSDKSNQYCWYPVPLTQDEVSRFFESYENTMQNIDGLCKEKFGEQGCTLIRETINNKDVELLAISFYGYRQNNVFRTHLANELKEQLLVQQTKEKDSFMCRITGMGCQTGPKPIQNNTTRNDTEIDCETYANCDESIQCPVECQLCTENDEQTHNITQQQADNSTANPVYMVYDKECYECTENDKCNPIICDDLKKLLNDSSYNHNKYDGHSLRRPMMLGVAIVAVAIGAGIGITYCIYKKWRARHHNPNNQQLMQQIAALQNQIAQLPGQLQQLLMQGQQQNNNQLQQNIIAILNQQPNNNQQLQQQIAALQQQIAQLPEQLQQLLMQGQQQNNNQNDQEGNQPAEGQAGNQQDGDVIGQAQQLQQQIQQIIGGNNQLPQNVINLLANANQVILNLEQQNQQLQQELVDVL